MHSRTIKCIQLAFLTALASAGCTAKPEPRESRKVEDHTKQVLLQEGGKERHWVILSGGLITEEHYLTAHGDLHVVAEYPTGVRVPQVESPQREKDVRSVLRVFWLNAKPMSVTPRIGEKANGQELVWWPSGILAREAEFALGTPIGVWKFYDVSGRAVGEGTYQSGKRWSGIFVGNDSPGAEFILKGDLKKQTFEGGVLTHEEGFADEEFIEKHFSKEMNGQ